MRRSLMTCSVLFCGVSACAPDGDEARPFPDVTAPAADARILGAHDGALHGDIGPVAGLHEDAELLHTYDDGHYVSVETVATVGRHAVMTLLSLVDGSAWLKPGTRATQRLDEHPADAPQMTFLGCVGREVGIYDLYDRPADETTLVVDEGVAPGELDVVVEGRWLSRDGSGQPTGEAHTARTTFALQR